MMEAESSSETVLSTYQITRYHDIEDHNTGLHCLKNLKSHANEFYLGQTSTCRQDGLFVAETAELGERLTKFVISAYPTDLVDTFFRHCSGVYDPWK
jgi:hypothetical protein